MKYPPIDKRLFIKNRKDFVDKMKPNSVAIFLSNDIMPTNADGTMPFVQNTNLQQCDLLKCLLCSKSGRIILY